MIRCYVCRKEITKYYQDTGDTVILKVKGEEKFFCDDCSYKIAKQRITR